MPTTAASWPRSRSEKAWMRATFDRETKQIFSAQGDGSLTIIKEASAGQFSVQQNVVTQ